MRFYFDVYRGLRFLCVASVKTGKNGAVITVVSNVGRVTFTLSFLEYRSLFTFFFPKHVRIHPNNIKIQIERALMQINFFAEKNYIPNEAFLLYF